jgi:hypothetical protein
MKTRLAALLTVLAALLLTACSQILDVAREVMYETSTVETAPSTGAAATPETEEERMEIRLRVNDAVVTATLVDSETTRDFISLLPLTLTLEDYAGTEKISYLPQKLSNEGAPAGSDPSVGDITYYAPWGNLAIVCDRWGVIQLIGGSVCPNFY